MADNFNFKQFLVENKLGAYSKAGKLNEGFNDHQDINTGDESDAPPTIDNPRNPREVAAEIKAQNPSIGQDWAAIKAAAESIMVAAFHAQGLNMGKAMTATRILLGGTHPTYSEFPQQLYDAVTGGGVEEAIAGIGGDNDYDRRGDAERTGETFIPWSKIEQAYIDTRKQSLGVLYQRLKTMGITDEQELEGIVDRLLAKPPRVPRQFNYRR